MEHKEAEAILGNVYAIEERLEDISSEQGASRLTPWEVSQDVQEALILLTHIAKIAEEGLDDVTEEEYRDADIQTS